MTAMGDPIIKQRLIENTEHSVGRGTFGSPTLFVGDEIYFGKGKLRDAIEAAQALTSYDSRRLADGGSNA